MGLYRGVLVAVVIGASIAAVAGTVAGGPAPGSAQSATDGNVSMGTQLSSFMQASVAETNGSVDAEMWAAEFETATETERPAVVDSRIRTLERRRDRLETQLAQLEAAGESESAGAAYTARATRLTMQIETLDAAINRTDSAADRVGVNRSRLDRLRSGMAAMRREPVTRVARRVPAVNPPGLDTRGPQADTGGRRGREASGRPATTGQSADIDPDERGPSTTGPDRSQRGPAGNVTADGPRETGAEVSGNTNRGRSSGPPGGGDGADEKPTSDSGPAAADRAPDTSGQARTDRSSGAEDSDPGQDTAADRGGQGKSSGDAGTSAGGQSSGDNGNNAGGVGGSDSSQDTTSERGGDGKSSSDDGNTARGGKSSGGDGNNAGGSAGTETNKGDNRGGPARDPSPGP